MDKDSDHHFEQWTASKLQQSSLIAGPTGGDIFLSLSFISLSAIVSFLNFLAKYIVRLTN